MCPTQFEGTLEDGRTFYIRYRWGYFSFKASYNKSNDVMDAVRGEEIFGERVGGEFDGALLTEELQKILSKYNVKGLYETLYGIREKSLTAMKELEEALKNV